MERRSLNWEGALGAGQCTQFLWAHWWKQLLFVRWVTGYKAHRALTWHQTLCPDTDVAVVISGFANGIKFLYSVYRILLMSWILNYVRFKCDTPSGILPFSHIHVSIWSAMIRVISLYILGLWRQRIEYRNFIFLYALHDFIDIHQSAAYGLIKV